MQQILVLWLYPDIPLLFESVHALRARKSGQYSSHLPASESLWHGGIDVRGDLAEHLDIFRELKGHIFSAFSETADARIS